MINENDFNIDESYHKLLLAEVYGFFADKNDYWRPTEFIIDFDFFEKDFCLRSILHSGGLGHTRFYFRDYGKTWALNKEELE